MQLQERILSRFFPETCFQRKVDASVGRYHILVNKKDESYVFKTGMDGLHFANLFRFRAGQKIATVCRDFELCIVFSNMKLEWVHDNEYPSIVRVEKRLSNSREVKMTGDRLLRWRMFMRVWKRVARVKKRNALLS